MLNLSQQQLAKISFLSNTLMILTSVHHIYGAIIYQTPWRLHILYLALPVLVSTLILANRIRSRTESKRILSIAFLFVTLIFSTLLIGVYEGLYNHLLKNILFFAGVARSVMDQLFIVGLYEVPNDFIFEITGIGQGVLAVALITQFIRLIKFSPSNP